MRVFSFYFHWLVHTSMTTGESKELKWNWICVYDCVLIFHVLPFVACTSSLWILKTWACCRVGWRFMMYIYVYVHIWCILNGLKPVLMRLRRQRMNTWMMKMIIIIYSIYSKEITFPKCNFPLIEIRESDRTKTKNPTDPTDDRPPNPFFSCLLIIYNRGYL